MEAEKQAMTKIIHSSLDSSDDDSEVQGRKTRKLEQRIETLEIQVRTLQKNNSLLQKGK